MKSLQELQNKWERFAQADPLWAVCSHPEKRNRQWSREEFFASGRNEISVVLAYLAQLGVTVDWNKPALDFGCGVGRLTQAMATHFPECCGVDISPTMIRLAIEFNQDVPSCRFLLNGSERLEHLQDSYYGFIYTSIVLQHIAEKYALGYIRELLRALRPEGVFIFQIPDELRISLIKKWRVKLALRAKMQIALGLTRNGFAYNEAMEMHCIPESVLRNVISENGGKVLDVRLTNSAEPAFCGNLQYLTQAPASGYVSKQYCVTKM